MEEGIEDREDVEEKIEDREDGGGEQRGDTRGRYGGSGYEGEEIEER